MSFKGIIKWFSIHLHHSRYILHYFTCMHLTNKYFHKKWIWIDLISVEQNYPLSTSQDLWLFYNEFSRCGTINCNFYHRQLSFPWPIRIYFYCARTRERDSKNPLGVLTANRFNQRWPLIVPCHRTNRW